ncbi:WPP domain-associated protein [Gastrolobium bilobum]|uniref:WPP domain-associated protein n=1 Tax=Gastrolobium bilobum TaxID=150636 RepID=UPI002AAFFF36|nr:WPP domain-associated protein [Gastrolobium bilobum]
MVIIDRLTKSAHIMPVKVTFATEQLARLYMKEIVRLHGVFESIVSDRDPINPSCYSTIAFMEVMVDEWMIEWYFPTGSVFCIYLGEMDETFGYMDGRFEVSLADSTMMWIVHYAMNRAQEKMKTKTGVIERLNEISKFYELAVMQLEGCLSIVHAETESSYLESNHEEVLNDLREIKDRLQGRLKESELAILEKDRELTQRLENELKLRHALKLKEREFVSLNVGHGIETSSHNAENDQTRRNEHGDGDFCELRTSVDQQMLNIKQRLEPQHDVLNEVPHNGIDRKKVEEMGSDIDILKQTMDLAFGKMQSALFLCEMRPKERQWKLTIEKDIMSILIRSFMRDFQENIKSEVRRDENQVLKCWQDHWQQLMNEVTILQHELSTLHETCPEDSDCSALSSPTKASPQEGGHEIPNRSPQKVEEMNKEEMPPKEEDNEDESNYVAKLIKSHESIIRKKNEELNWSKHGVSQESKAPSSKIRKQLNILKERIRAVNERMDNLTDWIAKLRELLFTQRVLNVKETLPLTKLSEVYEIDTVVKDVDTGGSAGEKVKGVSDAGNEVQEAIRLLNVQKKYNTQKNFISENKHGFIDGLVVEFDSKPYNFDSEKLIQEHVYKYCLREIINEWNESTERNTIESKIRDDINLIVLSEAVKDISSNQEFALIECKGGETEERCLQCSTSCNQVDEIESKESTIRDHVHDIVFSETLKTFVNSASSASIEQRQSSVQDNFLDQLQFTITEILLKEDVYMVVFKATLKEWKLELDNYYMENFIREKIHRVIMVETLNKAFLSPMEVKSPVQDNTIEDNYSPKTLNPVQKVQGHKNLTIILLESLLGCFEAEENLMLSAQSEIKEHSKQLDLGSERGDLHEHEIFEDLITGEEQTFSSLTNKVEKVLQQLGTSKALLRELGTSLGHSLRDSESFHFQMSSNEEGQLKLSSSIFFFLLNLSPTFTEFEGMVGHKFEMMTMRLEKMKCCLDPVIELVDSLRSKELIYQKAFIRRCQNLEKAEAEVDLLGDQVDALLTLLEKIYVTLHQRAPALQQYFEVSNILELIKSELIIGGVQNARVVT